MPSERTQRQIDRLLDEAEHAIAARDWTTLRQHALDVLRLDPTNEDARTFLTAAERDSAEPAIARPASADSRNVIVASATSATPGPTSFASGRYLVKKFLGEGGKKKVYWPTTGCSIETSPSR
jgi:hypothetical protein